MAKYERAFLRDGGSVEFEVSNPAGSGGMKQVFFVKGRHQVVAFFHDPTLDPLREERLSKVIGGYNPTRDGGGSHPDYWREVFCWPTDMVDHPTRGVGIVAPAYPKCFFFSEGHLTKGKEKSGSWFNCIDRRTGRSFRHIHVAPSERGDLRMMLHCMLCIARGVSRMHLAGLAHSDLSENNVLIDPTSGRALIIDVDSLVVKGTYPPDVLGTPGYIAPEVLATRHLDQHDANRKHPDAETDKHALAVMIYKYLLERHPLEGRRVIKGVPAEHEDELLYGREAIYCEHRSDSTNRPVPSDFVPASALGSRIADLFHRAFVEGLARPVLRPSASEWVNAIQSAIDNLVRCTSTDCAHGWFVLGDAPQSHCPFCRSRRTEPVVRFRFEREDKRGWFRPQGVLAASQGGSLECRTRVFRFHLDRTAARGAGEDTTPLAEVLWLESPFPGFYLHNLHLSKLGVRSVGSGSTQYHRVEVSRKVLLDQDTEICFEPEGALVRANIEVL
jgi:hypothetical protein